MKYESLRLGLGEDLIVIDTAHLLDESPIKRRFKEAQGTVAISVPGSEFPSAVYRCVVIAFCLVLLFSWLVFTGTSEINPTNDLDLALGMATVLFVMMLGIPVVAAKMAKKRTGGRPADLDRFLVSQVDIATGAVSGREAFIQVLLIPVALVVATVAIGGAFIFGAL
jgi:hypothetical protein